MPIKLSVDDGCASDVRLASLALKYEIPTTFYWLVEWHSLAYDNGYEPLTYAQAVTIAKQFEVGSHTITHRHLTKIPPEEAYIEIAESQLILREMFDQPIEKFCPPRGYTNTELTLFASRYYKEMRLTRGGNLVHVHPNSGANNNVYWRHIAESTEDLHLWMHSWELDKYKEWDSLEEFLDLYSQ